MSMSSHVEAFKPADAKWKKMKAVYDSCVDADATIPVEVSDFFGDQEPHEDSGVLVEIQNHKCCQEWSAEGREGLEIDISLLPKDVKIIRFYNAY